MQNVSLLDSTPDDEFLAALGNATSWSELLRALGYSGSPKPKIYTAARERASLLDADTATLDSRGTGPVARWSKDDLRRAVAHNETITGVADALRANVSTVRTALLRSDIDATHLSGLEPRVMAPALPGGPADPTRLRVAAEALASAWYTMHGFEVFTPANGTADCDLLATQERTTIRVQVKSTAYVHSQGNYFVGVGTSGRSRSWERLAFDAAKADELFVVCASGAMYRIPASQADGKASIALTSGYERYRVQMMD